MRKYWSLALVAVLALSACEGPRVDKLEERVASLENDVTELKQKLEQRPAGDPGALSQDQRVKAMETLKGLAEKMEEQTFEASSALKAGTGAVDVLVVPREDSNESRQNFIVALKDPRAEGLMVQSGVEVIIGDKSYGKTPAKGPLRIPDLAPGEYELKLVAEGFNERLYPFEVRDGYVKKIVTFLLAPGELHEARQGLQNLINQVSGQPQGGDTAQ